MGGWVLVGNAPWRWEGWSARLVRAATGVVAADGGANHLARLGVRPTWVVGDLDSLRPGVRAWVGDGRLVPRPDQDFTDLEKALAFAVEELGLRRLTLLAVTGGWGDHGLEALGVVGRWARRARLEVREPGCRVVPLHGQRTFAAFAGQVVSLLPLGRCEGVTTRGLRWPLRGEVLDLLERTSISNRALGQRVWVQVRTGTLLVFLHHPPGEEGSRPPR